MSNNNLYSYDESLAIADFIIGLERHTRLTPDAPAGNLMGTTLYNNISTMNHGERISLLKEVVANL